MRPRPLLIREIRVKAFCVHDDDDVNVELLKVEDGANIVCPSSDVERFLGVICYDNVELWPSWVWEESSLLSGCPVNHSEV